MRVVSYKQNRTYMRLFLIMILASVAMYARSQQEEASKLEAVSGLKSGQGSLAQFLTFGAETDIDAGAEDKFCLRLAGQVSGLQEENFFVFGALPGFRKHVGEMLLLEFETGPGIFLVQEKVGETHSDPSQSSSAPELAPAGQVFGRFEYGARLYGEGYLINAFCVDGAISHVKAELGYRKKRWNPFVSYDTLYQLAAGTRFRVGKDLFRFMPGFGLALSGHDIGAVFSVVRSF